MNDAMACHRLFAFLRAINVGGHIVKMDRLRALFRELDFDAVETFIASGNVVFETALPGVASGAAGAPAKGGAAAKHRAALEARIEACLADALGYEVATFLRTRQELAAIAAANPFAEDPGPAVVYVGLLKAEPAAAARDALTAFGNEADVFRITGRELWWLARKGLGKSTFSGARLERTLGMPTTLRNVNTVHRLLAKYDETT